MAQLHVAAERTIAAPPEQVYRYIADYRQHHPRFLPPAFGGLSVRQGGVGAGTQIEFQLTLGGRTRTFQAEITEPEPGRVLVEAVTDGSSVTTFTVLPEGDQSRVRIETQFRSANGIIGLVERLLGPRMLRSLYIDELDRLDRYAREQSEG